MGLFDIFNRKKKERELRIQQEAERMKMEEALNAYKAIGQGEKQKSTVEYIAVGDALSSMVDKQEYDSLLDCLDKITLTEGRLVVEGIKPEASKDKSALSISLPGGRNDENIFGHLQIDHSCMGAWQAYLLHILWHTLPLFGHAIYKARDYLFSEEDRNSINIFNEADRESIHRSISYIDLNPEVQENNGKFYISCCYWSNFCGLVREYSEISIENNKVTDIVQFDERFEYRYDCGIRF